VTTENPDTKSGIKDLVQAKTRNRRLNPVLDTDGAHAMPRYRRRRVDLRTLSGTARESARRYLEWSTGRISTDDYLVSVRGLSEHRGNLLALEQERTREEVAKLHETVSQIRSGAQHIALGHAGDGDAHAEPPGDTRADEAGE
jgi:hypothetical protein